jgi:hypothetical protein
MKSSCFIVLLVLGAATESRLTVTNTQNFQNKECSGRSSPSIYQWTLSSNNNKNECFNICSEYLEDDANGMTPGEYCCETHTQKNHCRMYSGGRGNGSSKKRAAKFNLSNGAAPTSYPTRYPTPTMAPTANPTTYPTESVGNVQITLTFDAAVNEVALKESLAAQLGVSVELITLQTSSSSRRLVSGYSYVVIIAAPTLDDMQAIQEAENQNGFAAELTLKINQSPSQAQAVAAPHVSDVNLDVDEAVMAARFPDAPPVTDFPTKQPTSFPTPYPTHHPCDHTWDSGATRSGCDDTAGGVCENVGGSEWQCSCDQLYYSASAHLHSGTGDTQHKPHSCALKTVCRVAGTNGGDDLGQWMQVDATPTSDRVCVEVTQSPTPYPTPYPSPYPTQNHEVCGARCARVVVTMTLPQGWNEQQADGNAPPYIGTHERMQHAVARVCHVNVLDVSLTEEQTHQAPSPSTLITATISTNDPTAVKSFVESQSFTTDVSGEAGVEIFRESVLTTELCAHTNCTIDSVTERMVVRHSHLDGKKKHMCGEPTWVYGSAQSDSIQCACECIDSDATYVEPTSNLNGKHTAAFKAWVQSNAAALAAVNMTELPQQHTTHVGKTDNANTKYPTPAP